MPERPRVKQLPDQLANQIAAGEVVARPASVVKELIENALDAGASSIRVELEGGGIALSRVVDDGAGMHPEDVELALSRHATSKIDCLEDLRAIHTLGFRGEALPSIASVSRLTLRTRRAVDEVGTELRIEGGGAAATSPCGAAPGTTVEVAELFYNVPARRKFLRAVATEAAHVSEVVRSAALANHEVQLELVRDGRRARRWLSMSDVAERVSDVLHDLRLSRCSGARGPIAVEAYLSEPDRARSGAGGLHLFVNRRPVHDRALARAVATAYGDALERGRFPVGAVFLSIPEELVDVNVHPQKAEVRFAHARAVSDALHQVLAEALSFSGAPAGRAMTKPKLGLESESSTSWEWRDSGARELPPAAAEPEEPAPSRAPGIRPLALVRHRFVVCDAPDGLWLVELRRARAAELHRRAGDELERGGLVAQRLLFPIVRPVDSRLAERIEASEAGIQRLGFDLRRSGPTTAVAHALPRLFSAGPGELLVDEVLAALANPSLEERLVVERLVERVAGAEPALDDDEARAFVAGLAARGALDDSAIVAAIAYDDVERS